jgi:hypothetical protein
MSAPDGKTFNQYRESESTGLIKRFTTSVEIEVVRPSSDVPDGRWAKNKIICDVGRLQFFNHNHWLQTTLDETKNCTAASSDPFKMCYGRFIATHAIAKNLNSVA